MRFADALDEAYNGLLRKSESDIAQLESELPEMQSNFAVLVDVYAADLQGQMEKMHELHERCLRNEDKLKEQLEELDHATHATADDDYEQMRKDLDKCSARTSDFAEQIHQLVVELEWARHARKGLAELQEQDDVKGQVLEGPTNAQHEQDARQWLGKFYFSPPKRARLALAESAKSTSSGAQHRPLSATSPATLQSFAICDASSVASDFPTSFCHVMELEDKDAGNDCTR